MDISFHDEKHLLPSVHAGSDGAQNVMMDHIKYLNK